jgi:hypothetical protein
MNKHTPNQNSFLSYIFFSTILLLVATQSLEAQISFSQSNLNFNGNAGVSAVTSLTFGPDDRLYVVEYPGTIKILTIERFSPDLYNVTNIEVLNDIQTIQDHNDDGTEFLSGLRETIGIALGGTALTLSFILAQVILG